jgi:pimeloyl-ACP methyl ester carboxylesterase
MDRNTFVKRVARHQVWLLIAALVWAGGCSSEKPKSPAWVDDEVSFFADGLKIYGTYRHRADSSTGPAALLISESGITDRNGDNAVAGKIGTMRTLAGLLSDRGVASLRYDKVGTGRTGPGPYANRPTDVGSAVYTSGAKAAVRFLASQSRTDANRISVYGHGEGATHALMLATDKSVEAPKVHALGLLQPLAGRYLDLVTARVRADTEAAVKAGRSTPQQADEDVAAWTAAVAQARRDGTVGTQLPDGLSAILNPANVKAVVESDAINPVALAMLVDEGTPVLLTCSDSDGQATCQAVQPLAGALAHTKLDYVALNGVSHVLKDDPTDSVTNYAKHQPLTPQLVGALDGFVAQ